MIAPRLHLFVCANQRSGASPLGPGCAANGEAVYGALKSAVAGIPGAVSQVWITKTHCLGICPTRGATVARYPRSGHGSPIITEVLPGDVATLLSSAPTEASEAVPLAALAREIGLLEELQRKKVLDLARRLKPGLTLEDMQNPHDFPELDDPDWHYADGVLAGIASVKSALSALRADADANAKQNEDG